VRVLVIAAQTQASPWTVIVLAVLGSSALGAVVGGYMTTRMRGRIEREEEWRTRLIEAADDLNKMLVRVAWTLGGLLPSRARGEQPLRDENGDLTDETAKELDSAAELMREAEAAFGRIELLYGSASTPCQKANESINLLHAALGLTRGKPGVQRAVEAAWLTSSPAAVEGRPSDAPFDLLAGLSQSGTAAYIALTTLAPSMPEAFDVSDDANQASWARLIHRAAATALHDYMSASRGHIENYRLQARHPHRRVPALSS